eukprot:gene821-1299_t
MQYAVDLPHDAYGVELAAISLLGGSAEGVVNITIQGTLVEHAQRHYVEIGLGTTAVTVTSRYILYPEVFASYILFITKQLEETDIRLDGLHVDPGVLVPAFDDFTTYYEVWVPYGEEEVRYYLEFSEGRVEIDGEPILNGTWQPVQYPTAEGNSSVSTIVMYQDEASKRRQLRQAAAACTYSIQVIKGVYNAPPKPPGFPLSLEDSDDNGGGAGSNSEEGSSDVFSASAGAGMISIMLGLIVGVALLAILVRRRRQKKEKTDHSAENTKSSVDMLANYFSGSDSINSMGRKPGSLSEDPLDLADANGETEVFNPLAFPSPQNRFESFSHGDMVRDKFKKNLDFLDEFGSKLNGDKKMRTSVLDATEFAQRKAQVMEGTGAFSDLVSEFNPMASGGFDGLEMTSITEGYEEHGFNNKNKRASLEDLSQYLSRKMHTDGMDDDDMDTSFNPMLVDNTDALSSGGLLGEELESATFANPLLGGVLGQGGTEVVTQNPLSMLSKNEEAMMDFNTMTPQELVTEVIQNVEVDLAKLISTMERVPAFHQKMMNDKVAEAQDQVMVMVDASDNQEGGSGEMMRLCETASQIFALLAEAQQMADHWESLQEANQAVAERSTEAETAKVDTAAHLMEQLTDIKGKLRHVGSIEKKDRRGSIADGVRAPPFCLISDELRNKLLARRVGQQWKPGGRKASGFLRKTSIHQIASLAQQKLKGLAKPVDKEQLAKSRQRFAKKQASMRIKTKREEESAQNASTFADSMGAAVGGMGAAVGGMFSALNPFASKNDTKTPETARKNSFFASVRKPSFTGNGGAELSSTNGRSSSRDNGQGDRSGLSGEEMPSRKSRAGSSGTPLANIAEDEQDE